MTKKQKVTIVGLIDLFIMICAIASLALEGIIFYILEAIFVVSWLFTSTYIYKRSKELSEIKNDKDNNFEYKTKTLAKVVILSSLIFAIIMTIIVLIAFK